ncbi:OmpA family protein [Lutibacter holmesii]|uniref:OmpA family protein n=1 Tax=Lutibacter holmesii TaxID=1137985 RepID=A0ABW3WM45_9FLAO
MKHLKVALLALLLVTGFSNVNAQDENNPWAIGFGVNAVDFYPTNPQTEWGGNWYSEFFNANDHYNIVPAVSRLTVARYLAAGFSFEAAGSFNKIENIGDMSVDDYSFWTVDGSIKYDVNKIIGDTKWFDPYVLIGGGYTWMDDLDTASGNAGVGANFWFNDNVGLSIETRYRHTFDSDLFDHWQHSAGITFKMGGKDTDGDGVYDKKDACPDVFGLAEFNGCPDTDGDGVIDSEDACVDVAGLAELKGCPDADADGITDAKDACPNDKGTAANGGCPDTDGDGVVDKDDACPTVAGPVANKGCVWPDTDADGVADKDDKCPNVAGPASNNGCPEGLTDADLAKLKELGNRIYFDTEKDTFKSSETETRLDEAYEIIKAYPETKLHIEGHTDATGPDSFNNKLSKDRADTVRDYLISKGYNPENLTSEGYGSTQPVDSNKTKEGRAMNRRVEIKLQK